VGIFLERFLLPAFATAVIAVAITNPMNFDIAQRISGCLALIFAAYFVAHTAHKMNKVPAAFPSVMGKPNDQTQTNIKQSANMSGPGALVLQAAGAGSKIDYRAEMSEEDRKRFVNEASQVTAEKLKVAVAETAKDRFKEIKCGPNPNIGCPLQIDFILSPDPHPTGSVYGGIKWENIDSDLRIHFRNAGTCAIQDISLELRPDVHIVAMKQMTKIADVTVAPVLGPVLALEVVMTMDSDGSQRSIPTDPNDRMGHAARILCPKLLPNAEMQLVFACRRMNSLQNGEFPKTLFSEKRIPPQRVHLNGSYVISENGIETRYNMNSEIRLPKPGIQE
jgi:hypothetical protein